MKKDLTNIHNNFFLHLLSKKENAIDFLRISLPKDIFSQIDFDYLDFDKQSLFHLWKVLEKLSHPYL